MEKLDKSTIIGFILLFVMYGTYVYFNPPAAEEPTTKTEKQLSVKTNTIASDSIVNISSGKKITLENEDIVVEFDSKGAKINKVVLKKYKSYKTYIAKKGDRMSLFDEPKEGFEIQIPISQGSLNLSSIVFTPSTDNQKVEGKSVGKITFSTQIEGKPFSKTYSIKGTGFEIQENWTGQGIGQGKDALIIWNNNLKVVENDLLENRKATQINYVNNEESFESVGLNSPDGSKDEAEQPVKWFSYKQKYFTQGLVFENGQFENVKLNLNIPDTQTDVVKSGKIEAQIPSNKIDNANFRYYFGPNELSTLKQVESEFSKNLYLGYDIIKPINKYVFVPLFKFVESFVHNYGILIIIVVLIIKTLLTPLIYKSYVSSAKMRILTPEINAIKEKIGDDAIKVQQETMKLYQQVGASPLSGCIPLLLQMPILMSVFFLFPNMIMFRQKSFLWASDLSTYDAPIQWVTHLPIIGNHISLFVVLMTLSSLAFTYYNNQVTPDQPGPIDMKKLSYIFPLIFFFVLNSFPAALSFYYLVSNVVTIGQQLAVRKFIDEDKIKAILEQNRKNFKTKPQKSSKFGNFLQKQLQASEEAKRKVEDTKNTRKKK